MKKKEVKTELPRIYMYIIKEKNNGLQLPQSVSLELGSVRAVYKAKEVTFSQQNCKVCINYNIIYKGG